MRSRHQIALACVLTILAFGSAQAASPIGTAVSTSTTVSAGGRTLQKSSPIFFNDLLRSNATGLGQFVFDDGTKLAMGPSASLKIDQSIYKGKRTLQQASIQASKGAFRYISGAVSGHKIATPYGTIGIRGTAFDFTIRNGKVYILLFRGAVSFCNGGTCKTLRRSCDYLVGGGGGVSDPKPLSTAIDSGLNIGQVFPLTVNQGKLNSQFRQGTKGCYSRAARRAPSVIGISPEVQAAASEPPGAPASPAGKSNKGFGNGGEADDNGPTETQNPGKGNSFGRNK
ncbi:FecR family protein [Taklimakanibacter lacteus]|uniref:FecR family protein n=1 Tax=Taklimakanibacter lacteus TaxID=2268456 RepID=UPI000E66596C